MMGAMGGAGLLGTLVYLGLAAGLVTVGLTHVRKVHPMAGYCLAGAGAIEGFQAIVGLLSSLLYAFMGPGIFTVTSLLGLLTGLASGAGLLGAIFFLAGALKNAPAQQNAPYGMPGYGVPPGGYGPGPGPGYGPPPGYGPGPGPGQQGPGGPGYGPPPGYGPGPGPGPGY